MADVLPGSLTMLRSRDYGLRAVRQSGQLHGPSSAFGLPTVRADALQLIQGLLPIWWDQALATEAARAGAGFYQLRLDLVFDFHIKSIDFGIAYSNLFLELCR